jgi:hypothetical protein
VRAILFGCFAVGAASIGFAAPTPAQVTIQTPGIRLDDGRDHRVDDRDRHREEERRADERRRDEERRRSEDRRYGCEHERDCRR